MSATGCDCGCGKLPCECCVGTQVLTPVEPCNRPGLPAIVWRVGNWGAFFETMKARLSTMTVDVVLPDGVTHQTQRPLNGLTTRDPGDFSIALLDAWAVIGDVLTFYQERIANEAYLRTATERRSVLELARLVGYRLRPGVAASVYLAYTIDEQQAVSIPAGARSQSVPAPGETAQSFETRDELIARAAWNTLRPRSTRPQIQVDLLQRMQVYLAGANTQLKVNDPLLIDFGDGKLPGPFQVGAVVPDAAKQRTLVSFAPWPGTQMPAVVAHAEASAPAARAAVSSTASPAVDAIGGKRAPDPAIALMQRLSLPPSLPPRNTLNLARSLQRAFRNAADLGTQVVGALQPTLQATLGAALSRVPGTPASPIRAYALRTRAAPFGNVAPLRIDQTTPTVKTSEWVHADMLAAGESPERVHLDAGYDKIAPGSWLLIDTSAVDWAAQHFIHQAAQGSIVVASARAINAGIARAAYGITGKATQLLLGDVSGNAVDWYENGAQPEPGPGLEPGPALAAHASIADLSFQLIRGSAIYAQSEELPLADMPITDAVCHGAANSWIELDGYYADLKSGRWAIVSGERADLTTSDPAAAGAQVDVSGVQDGERVMLANVIQDIATADGTPLSQASDDGALALPGETLHTFIQFAADLAYCYTRDALTIHGNVVEANHGETRNETLGSGDGTQLLQSFTLKQAPLTFVAAPTVAGAQSSLHAYVNGIEWHETDSLAWLGPRDRGFATLQDDAGNTSLRFGNGVNGARLPTGLLNVGAVYRNGIGQPGNVAAGQISQLQTRPLGVKAVINPLRASGGADADSRDLARENAPLSVMPLDRLVSVQDYADFSRGFAGVGKALAQRTSDGRRQLVYLSIAGVDDAPIDKSSDLYRNLSEALLEFGDPDLPLRVELRELALLVLSARIRVAPDYVWETVAAALRAQLLDRFGFDERGLGQSVLLSELIAAIQNTRGVDWVDVDALGAIPEMIADTAADGTPYRRPRTPAEVLAAVQAIAGTGAALDTSSLRAARDRLPGDIAAWPGGSDAGVLRPAELLMFSPALPDTLILNQIT